MYTFQKLMIDNKTLLALKVEYGNPILINFCMFARALNLWKMHMNGIRPHKTDELENAKKRYRQLLLDIVEKYGYALVDISNGQIIEPTILSESHIIEEYQGPLPF